MIRHGHTLPKGVKIDLATPLLDAFGYTFSKGVII